MRRIAALFGLLLLLNVAPAQAALSFPALTGRVVDAAHILSPATVQSLDQSLAAYENGTTNQVVVATIPSLKDDSIDDYGYQLGRHWQIGQKGKDNGALLIVAPAEHKVRIEVGYGLEGVLTDAAASQIVNQIILPDFRAGQMEQGVIDGTQAMLAVLGGKSVPVAQQQDDGQFSWIGAFLFFLFLLFAIRHPYIALYFLLNSRGGGYSSGGGGGGFSGGGGSFGGGGASGSW